MRNALGRRHSAPGRWPQRAVVGFPRRTLPTAASIYTSGQAWPPGASSHCCPAPCRGHALQGPAVGDPRGCGPRAPAQWARPPSSCGPLTPQSLTLSPCPSAQGTPMPPEKAGWEQSPSGSPAVAPPQPRENRAMNTSSIFWGGTTPCLKMHSSSWGGRAAVPWRWFAFINGHGASRTILTPRLPLGDGCNRDTVFPRSKANSRRWV